MSASSSNANLPAIDYFEHEADIGIIGRGATLEEAFCHAANAMFAIISSTPLPHSDKQVVITFEEPDIELALVTWLNLLIAQADSHHYFFTRFELHHDGAQWKGKAWGVQWDNTIEPGVDVKGATLTLLTVAQKNNYWEARCVVDV